MAAAPSWSPIATKDTKSAPWKAKALERLDEKIAGRLGTPAEEHRVYSPGPSNRASGTAYRRRPPAGRTQVDPRDHRRPRARSASSPWTRSLMWPCLLPRGEKAARQQGHGCGLGGEPHPGRAPVASEEFRLQGLLHPRPARTPKARRAASAPRPYHVLASALGDQGAHEHLDAVRAQGAKKYRRRPPSLATPLVRYPLEDLAPGAKVKGQSIIELGSGNQPLNMFTYEKDGKSYVLMNTFRFHHKVRPFGPSPLLDRRASTSTSSTRDAPHQRRRPCLRPESQGPARPPIASR